MIASRFGFKTTLARRTGASVRGDPMTEPRIRADEMPPRVGGDPIIVNPFAVDHQAHGVPPFLGPHRSFIRSLPGKKAPIGDWLLFRLRKSCLSPFRGSWIAA